MIFENVFLLMDKATLLLWNEPKHNYVGLPVTEMNVEPLGLWISALGQFLNIKTIISPKQNVSIFQFHIWLPNFSLLGSTIKKVKKQADLLKGRRNNAAKIRFCW